MLSPGERDLTTSWTTVEVAVVALGTRTRSSAQQSATTQNHHIKRQPYHRFQHTLTALKLCTNIDDMQFLVSYLQKLPFVAEHSLEEVTALDRGT